jgi:PDZ domain
MAQSLEFTRPTLTAVRITIEPRFHRRVYEDGAYRFVSRDYGSGEAPTIPGLFVYSKQREAWIQILSLSTEHARLGRSPDFTDIPLPVSWDHGELINEPFASMPLRPGGAIAFPDRIVDLGAEGAYRLDFYSGLNRDVSLTWLWLAKADLQEAFEGRRTPGLIDKRDLRGVEFDTDTGDGLIVAVRVGNGERLRWRIDTKRYGILVDPYTTRITVAAESKDPRLDLGIGGTALLEQPVTLGRASTSRNIGGILGTAFFDRFAVSLDYDIGRLRLIEPGAQDDDGQPIAIDWQYAAPRMNAKMVDASGRTRNARLCVDTVEPRALVLRQPASAARRLASLNIGPFRFDDLPVFHDPAIAAACDGVLGNGLLRRFRVTFDRRRQRLLLTPGALFNVPYDYDLTGLTIVPTGRAFAVGRVAFGTIAASAGLRAGDVLVEMDGRPVAGLDLRELRASFRHDGRERVLIVQRLGVSHVLKLAMPLLKQR